MSLTLRAVLTAIVLAAVQSLTAHTAAALPPSHYDWPGDGRLFDPCAPVVNGADECDVLQGSSPTCAFLSSLSAAVRGKWVDPATSIKHLGGARYSVRLWNHKTGYWSDVEVTYRGHNERDPLPRDPGEFWVALYQRAYLRLWDVNPDDDWRSPGSPCDGTYMYMSPGMALRAIVGRTYERHLTAARSEAELATHIGAAWGGHARRPVVIGTYPDKSDSRYGHGIFVGQHAYTVLSANKDGIQFRNPWGKDREFGHRSVSVRFGPDGNPVYGYNPGHSDGYGDDPTDGIFLMSWAQFKLYFEDYWVEK